MLNKLRGRLNYANVMATVAVFLALGGGAYAALKLPKNSVKTKQIKNGAVTEKKLKDGAVSGPKIAVGAVGAEKIAAGAVGADKIAAASISPDKLAAGTRGVSFRYSRPIGSSADEVIAESEGYRVAARCEDAAGLPRARTFLTVPETGQLQGLQVTDPSNGLGTAAAGLVPVQANTPNDLGGLVAPTAGERLEFGGYFTYLGAARSAQLTLNVRADDDTDVCTVSGMLLPLG